MTDFTNAIRLLRAEGDRIEVLVQRADGDERLALIHEATIMSRAANVLVSTSDIAHDLRAIASQLGG